MPGAGGNFSSIMGSMRATSALAARDGNSGLETRDCLVAEIADEGLGAVELERQDQRGAGS